VARIVLDENDAGRYALGAIAAKIAFWLPQAVGAVLKVSPVASGGALCSAPMLVLLAGEQGILQGRSRFRELATVLGGAAVIRVTPAVILLACGLGAAPALWAGAAGAATAAVIARRITDTAVSDRPGVTWVLGVAAVFRAVQVQAALTALSAADLLVARIVLDENDAGRYALGAIAAKIAFWLPQAVGVVLYPRMAQPQHSARAMRSALAVLLGIGAVTVLGAAVAAPLAPMFAGQDYAPIEGLLWLFALEGALLAVLQAALLSAIAADRTAPAAITWIGLAVGVTVMLTCAHSVLSLIVIATVTAAATTLAITGIALRTAREDAEKRSPVPDLGMGGT
ncbi:polysaccharide biosynthesis protein, partial [Nocardia sp. NPDC004722]